MSQRQQQVWLQGELTRLSNSFGTDRERHKRLAVFLKAVSVSMAGLVTILLGWKVPIDAHRPLLANLALVLGALITVVSAYEAFFDPRALWVRETLTFARLRDLQRAFDYAVAGAGEAGLDDATVAEYKGRLDAILDNSLLSWLRMRGVADPSAGPTAHAGA
jgi:hypothetical protein